MTVLEVLTYPDARLKRVADPVERFDAALRGFVADLVRTMAAGPAAVGIAAPQVGRLQRLVIVDVSTRPRAAGHGRLVLINPEITAWEGHAVGREGCLSVPDYTGNVIRAECIRLSARDEHGGSVDYEMEGFEARVVQHEMDHLDGLLFLDRLVSRRSDLFARRDRGKGS
ncbi:peptide deformylase [bacterium BMS3Bbin12]|nr:peptide deformylase [bacterium BMS3Abin12]GBE47150.1 peptide deformylase [bacterium BMS3Bbin12]GBE49549.1 peptide deformylase [bacterium BMS3Bbin13]HDJ86134.1 peptide deformylase [Chromatiales bacterium]HDK03281.1 peptide deformylase [Gammaproteobacteria bacterium]